MKPNHETIYLVPTDYDGGQLTYSWCDCPAPGEGMDPEDAIKYVRADLVPASNEALARRIIELTNERDQLRAQVDRLLEPAEEAAEALGFASHHLRGRASEKMLMDMAEKADALISAIGSTPTQCLAARDAEIARVAFIAAINATGQGYNGEIGLSDDEIVDLAELYVKRKVSQQAKGE